MSLKSTHESADWWWRDTTERAIAQLAATGRKFTAWDLTQLGVPDPEHPNRWGALFKYMYDRGVIEPVGYVPSPRPTRSGGVCREWVGISTDRPTA